MHVSNLPIATSHGLPRSRQCGLVCIPAVAIHADTARSKAFSIAQGGTYEVVCNDGRIAGKYVFVVIPGNAKILTLCEVEVYGLSCDRDCHTMFHEHEAASVPVPGAGVDHAYCHELSSNGSCDEKKPLVSTQSHVSTWGVDH